MSGGVGPNATQQQAVELLNSIGLAASANDKVDLLKALLELVVHKQSALLPEFLPHVLELQCDPAAGVRKFLPDFVDAAIVAAPSPPVLTPALTGLRGLAGDGTPAVAKRALGSCYTAFRAAYVVLALQGASVTGVDLQPLRELWAAAQELKAAVLQLTSAHGGNDAVRLAAAKFLEQAALLLTAESVPAVTGVSPAAAPLPPGNSVFSKADLVKEAEASLSALVAILRLKLGGPDASGPLAITAIKAAGTVAQQRPQFMGRLLPPLLVLANSGEYKLDGSGGEGGGGGVQSSIAAALKSALAAVSKCQHPTAVPWRRKVADGLHALGSSALAGESSSSSSRDGKRPRAEEPNASKRPKLEPAGQQHDHQASVVALGVKPAPGPMQRIAPPAATAMLQPAAAAPAPSIGQAQQLPAGAPLPPPTPMPQLAQVQQVAQALIAGQDAQTLAAFLNGLHPAVLADLVLALLHSLPPREALPPDSAPLDHWVQRLLALLGTAALPSLPAPVSLQQQQPKSDAGAAAPPIKAKTAPPLRLPPGVLAMRLEPLLLTAAQEQELRREAVLRILRTEKVPSHHLRAALVARLAASGTSEADGLADAVVKQLLIDLHTRGGYEIALQWLHVLYAQLCMAIDPSQSTLLHHEEFMESAAVGSGGTGEAAEADATGRAQQQAAAGAGSRVGSSGGGKGTAPVAGSLYEAVLLTLLRGLRTGLPPSDRTLVRLLTEAPALPMHSVLQHLQQLCGDGPDWATLSLLAARDVILQRPPNRPPVLNWVLEVAVSSNEDARGKAVRLVANRLFPEVSMSQQIEIYAQRQLDMLLAEQQPSTAETVAVEEEEQQQQGQQEQQGTTGAAAKATGNAGQGARPAVAASAADAASPQAAGPSEERAAQLCGLYCALCTKKHSLLRRLLEVYSRTSVGGQAAIRHNAGGLAKTLGATAPALLAVVADPPPGSLPLLLDMLHMLTDTAVPPQSLVAACLAVHASSRDPRTLVPALPGMDKAAVLRLLPSLLELPPEALRLALARLVAPLPAPEEGNAADAPPPEVAPFSPVEVLTALHTLDVSREPGLLRRVMQGVTVCLSSPALFPPEALAATINGLLIRVPLPQLFMRTVIQTLAAAPRLRAFVVGVLGQLGAKRIWEDAPQWKGWLLAAQQTVPDSFPILLQLPSAVLGAALSQLSEGVRQQLAAYVASPDCTIALPHSTRDVLATALSGGGSAAAD